MAQEFLQQSLQNPQDRTPGDRSSPPLDSAASPSSSSSSSSSSSRLNARAPEFVPRAPPPPPPLAAIHHGAAVSASPVMHVLGPQPSPLYYIAGPAGSSFDYRGGGGGAGLGEHEVVHVAVDPDPSPHPSAAVPREGGLSDDVVQKITKQVEYYFSDANLATTEHLMKFITKDPEGFVPMSVIAAFKKIKALVHNNSQLVMALRTSSKLVVSDDGKKVRRQQPITEADMEELLSRIVVAENLPEDHSYQNLMKVFSAVGSVKSIRTCYPQTPNGTAAATNRSTKLEQMFGNRLHAFVEYETIEDAEKAIVELNDENWRSGLRIRMLSKCLVYKDIKHGQGRGRRGHDGDLNGEEDVSTSCHPNEKQNEDTYMPSEASHEHVGEESPNDKDGAARRGKGRGRGGRGRGRGQHHGIARGGGHTIGTPPSSHPIHIEQPVAYKHPPGPRMPDGTRGFTMGRGKPVNATST